MTLFYQSLFKPRFIHQKLSAQPTPAEHKQRLHQWAETIRNGSIRQHKESELRGPFIQRFFVELLGYRPFGQGANWTIHDEQRVGSGAADTALGEFGPSGKTVRVPIELKGPDTSNLDAIMPGRHKSAVTQVWEYAMDIPGCRFLIVTNMLEIRLYAVGYTRQVYERFDILELADSDTAYQRFRLLLGADNLLGGHTARLLEANAQAEKEITRQLYGDYKAWRLQLLLSVASACQKPLETLIEPVQKLMDRILFIAFAEDRGLLPPKTLAQAVGYRDPYNPRPIWNNFQGLFRAIDQGSPTLNIPVYNGGLFAPDALLDELALSDETCRHFAALGEYDFAEEISVTVLGHIFEQSVSDLERLKAYASTTDFQLNSLHDSRQLAELIDNPARAVNGKRKQDGIVYTPDAITQFIVDETLKRYLEREQARIRAGFCLADGGWRNPTREEKKFAGGKSKLREPARLVEFLFCHAWRDRLRQIRVLDPACGSGAFLVAAFDVLDTEYRQVNEQIQAITGTPDLFDINREILNGNLYGVDLNPESIEITKLSLWLKTAQRGKALESLEANLRVGNSLIAEAEFSPVPFCWQQAFPAVFAAGGFDVVLGNPPYVRQERFSEVKPYLQQHYAVYDGVADLYAYFYELALRLLRPGGRMGYISSSTFFKSGSGAPLRRYLLAGSQLGVLVDFGDLQVFEGVTTYPVILVADKCAAPVPEGEVRFLALRRTLPESLSAHFAQHASVFSQQQLGETPWHLEDEGAARLRQKLLGKHPALKQVYGAPLYGIKTGLNDAFVIDTAVCKRLLAEDPKSAERLKPYLEGKDLKSWRAEPQGLWLIFFPKGWTRQVLGLASGEADEATAWATVEVRYPAIARWLQPFAERGRKRQDKGEFWWELRACSYYEKFESQKILYPDISQGPKFIADYHGNYFGNTCYFLPEAGSFLLALLNSQAVWFYLKGVAEALRGGEWRLRLFTDNIETIPIPEASEETRGVLGELANKAQGAAEQRRDLRQAFRRRVLTDLAPSAGTGSSSARLSQKLHDWDLLDFSGFHSELKKQFKTTIPLAERDDWQQWFEQRKAEITVLTQTICTAEQQINQLVYQLFNLTPAEIALIEQVD